MDGDVASTGADKVNFDEICPICGKKKDKKDTKNPCNKKAKLNLCPAKDEDCNNNKKQTVHGKEEIVRRGCSGNNCGSHGKGTILGKNIMSGSTWVPGVNAKTGANARLFKKQKDQHYLHTGDGSIEAHHLICSASMDERWIKICEMTGYNINCRLNGVFLPAEIKLACHTGLQRHKGNHSLGYGDGINYVEAVKMGLGDIISSIKRNKKKPPCNEDTTKQIVDRLNNLSNTTLANVQAFTWTIAWDSLTYQKGTPLGQIGCANSKKGEIEEKREYLQKKLETELASRGLNFTKVQSFDDMEKLKDAQEKAIEPAKCKLNRNHDKDFSKIRSVGYILEIGH